MEVGFQQDPTLTDSEAEKQAQVQAFLDAPVQESSLATVPSQRETKQQEKTQETLDYPGDPNATLPHEILGVAEDASQDDVKRAYRRMIRVFHPDVSKDPRAEEFAQKINEAYEQLMEQFEPAQEPQPPQPTSGEQKTNEQTKLLGQSNALELFQKTGVSPEDLITIEKVLTDLRELGPGLDPDTFDTSIDPPENVEEKKCDWNWKKVGIMTLCVAIDLSQGGYGIQHLMEKWVKDEGFPKLCEKIGVDPKDFLEMLDTSDACTFVFQMEKADKVKYLHTYTEAQLYELVRSLSPSERHEMLANHHDIRSAKGERLSDTDVDELIVKPLEKAGGKYADYVKKYQ